MEPATIFASAKFAYDTAKSIIALKSDVERNEAVSKVLEVLLSVQQDALSMQKEHSLLLTEKDNLIKKISEFEKWSEIESQYELQEVAPQTFVYSYKKSDKNTKPSHYICPQCYPDRKAYILQLYEIMTECPVS